eukprot:scaffold354_cov116-Isochrysis_galbana.AAC.8
MCRASIAALSSRSCPVGKAPRDSLATRVGVGLLSAHRSSRYSRTVGEARLHSLGRGAVPIPAEAGRLRGWCGCGAQWRSGNPSGNVSLKSEAEMEKQQRSNCGD